MGDKAQLVTFPAVDGNVVRLAEAGSALHHRVEHRLDVCRRPRDRAQNLGSGGLLLKSLADLSMSLRKRLILLLKLFEQAHVLDRDDGLVGKGLEEPDLLVRELANLRAAEGNRAERYTLTQ